MIIIAEFLSFSLSNELCLLRSEVIITSSFLVFIKNQLLKYIKEEEGICFFYHLFLITLLQVSKVAVQKQSIPMWGFSLRKIWNEILIK